ncbi:MAG: LCP family protein [Streptosporangiaceae bacterium]|nr:LCP family protein [Streptosporangiaceae bacterium]
MLGVKALAGKALYGLACIVAAVVLVVSGVAYYGKKAVNSLGTSPNLSGGPSTGPMNILIIGLESRTYWDGTSVDHHIATITHIGTAADGNGGNAANTLILLHIFADGRKAVGFSIPRDAYVPMAGTMGFGASPSKIDNAYGYAMAQQITNDLTAHPSWSSAQRNLDGNYAGQNAEIQTVQALTGVTINKFVELNLVGYYNMAKVFGGIEACVFPWPGGNTPSGYLAKDANLSDPVVGGTTGGYGSGSEVVPGIQHLPPEQALAFVRNRHTVPGGDTGRTYRQQAVIDYVLNNLKTGGVLSDISKLNSLLSSAKEYVQLPRNWDLVQFGGEISGLTPSKIALTTLPTTGSETAPNGVGAVSTVDIPAIRRIVQRAFSAPPEAGITKPSSSAKGSTSGTSGNSVRSDTSSATKAPAKPAPTALPAAKVTVDVINNGAPAGTARNVLTALAARGYTAGTAGNPPAGTPAQSLTTVSYGAGAAVNAMAIAKYFGPGITVTASSSLTADHVVVTLGVATQAVPASLVGRAPTSQSSGSGSASSGSASSRSASSTSGAAHALTPQEKQWAAEAKAKYGIPCVY